jgi:hypothetical protein
LAGIQISVQKFALYSFFATDRLELLSTFKLVAGDMCTKIQLDWIKTGDATVIQTAEVSVGSS